MVEKRIRDSKIGKRNLGVDTDTELEQCSGCLGMFKKRGLKIHQARKGCGKGSHRNTSKSEATSIQDTNHSDAHGRVNPKTTCRGKGAHNMEAMDMLTKEIKKEKITGESCREEGNVIAKGQASMEEKTDIRNWFRKEAEVKANIHQIKAKGEEVDSEKNESSIELVDISEDSTQPEHTEGRTEKSGAAAREFKEESTQAENNDRRSAAVMQGNIEKVDIKKGPSNEMLNVQLDLRRWDFQSLCGSEYLNDRIIDVYFRLIQERNEADLSLPKVYACSSHLYTGIVLRGLEATSKLHRRNDLRMKELIFVPIHNDQLFHWSLIVVETSTKVVYYFDSIPRERIHSPAPRIIKKYMEKYYENRGEKVSFKIKRKVDAPCQENGYDCGVFVCQYAEKIARRSPLNFSQKDLNHPLARARDRMIQELLEGRINLEWRMVYWANEVGRKQRDSGEFREKEEKVKEDTLKVEKQQRRRQKIK